ncbi:dockerin type I repeat-containing protein [Paenibacillus sp. y28]|uniref:dockerin type I repeat-containing protein n=1 Tax=Paenibacillus sp. y28 TaxID=3129110 RepID=UPI003017C442
MRTVLLKGDANGDGKITAADALIIYKSLKGTVTLTSDQIWMLDMNEDGILDALDAEWIMKQLTNR